MDYKDTIRVASSPAKVTLEDEGPTTATTVGSQRSHSDACALPGAEIWPHFFTIAPKSSLAVCQARGQDVVRGAPAVCGWG